MDGHRINNHISSFRIIIAGFLAVILIGAILLTLPVSSADGKWTEIDVALFTATSAVCVTGLVIKDTAAYWSVFGQTVILTLIQIGGLGIISVAALIATISGRKISLLQRSMLQESISAYQVGGVIRLIGFICRITFIIELAGALIMLPAFYRVFGVSGIRMSVFHSVSAFCNAGFDLMGDRSGEFSSLTLFYDNPLIIIPICFLIISGGIGFLTWNDIAANGFHFKRYRMQTKTILTATAVFIIVPAAAFFFNDFSSYGIKERLYLSVFQAVTPRTAGFNTADLTKLTDTGKALTLILMLIGGAPGSTAGGVKITTIAVLTANVLSVIRREKSPRLFDRRIEESTVKDAAALLVMYGFFTLICAFMISETENIPLTNCLFETASAIGTVGLSLGITPHLGLLSHMILILLMFFGRVGGLTLMFAAVNSDGVQVSLHPVEKINVG